MLAGLSVDSDLLDNFRVLVTKVCLDILIRCFQVATLGHCVASVAATCGMCNRSLLSNLIGAVKIEYLISYRFLLFIVLCLLVFFFPVVRSHRRSVSFRRTLAGRTRRTTTSAVMAKVSKLSIRSVR